ncbi:intradiol ring-cleavage dioxygenase [Streptomyces sp. NPDC002467]|uniref:intradiol ring-cleavage dioxygenase n=1 Tax=Streptomyces sp. NPDC002467 TaxID=3364647 RepID=UPI0036BBA588
MTNQPEFNEEPDNHQVSQLLSRRRLFALGGAGMAVIGLGAVGCSSGTGSSTPSGSASASTSASGTARLSAEQMEGPYYLDYELFRQDITEGKPGVPLALRLNVVDTTTGRPLSNAAVEVWQCDALGVYSGYASAGVGGIPAGGPSGGMPSGMPTGGFPSGAPGGAPGGMPDGQPGGQPGGSLHLEPTDQLTYLRGSQMSDSAGNVEFRTVFPGWYAGRALHIHTKVHVDGTHTDSGYQGGRVCHTGQLYFAEATATKIETLATYAANKATRMKLDVDSIYAAAGGGAKAGLLDLVLRDQQDIQKGIDASLTLGVDPSKTNTGTDSSTIPGQASGAPSASFSPRS